MNPTAEHVAELEFAEVKPDVRLDIYRGEEWITSFANDVRQGLTARPRALQPKYFYDAKGSELFDQICELPEYYPTRTEESILEARGADIVDAAAATSLVELGSGSSLKTEHLLRPLLANTGEALYVPIEFSESAVREASVRLVGDYPGLRVHGMIGDFEKHLGGLPRADARLFAFLGGTIGNFTPDEMLFFLKRMAFLAEPDDTLLVGIDLVKDKNELEAAYNDSAGVTAAFNKNVLSSINTSLAGNFDLDSWEHVAFFDEENQWIEMRLRATRNQVVKIAALDLTIDFVAGEDIRTEISRKFTRDGFVSAIEEAGLELKDWYTDEDERFALALCAPANGRA
ncbi:MAG: L-histidine N(alpha)-methyltransferase [Thermoleophilaceae bacterium]|nr:L-histidine N(alpha)-methyltransferase [Thermoleophilaceae bacterium]